jgi:phosphomannomutase / phosphoglucomutase
LSIFKACDIRGIFEEEWSIDDARQIGLALASMIRDKEGSEICVGGDYRKSTPLIKEALIAGLTAGGIDVCDIGQCPTPMVYYASAKHQWPNAAIVTASHNPARYNGIKFMIAGNPSTPEDIEILRSRMEGPVTVNRKGKIRSFDVEEEYLNSVLDLSLEMLPGRKRVGNHIRRLPVVLDTMCGAFTFIAPEALIRKGYQVITLNPEIDPEYRNGSPNPAKDENLEALEQRVAETGSCLGIAIDGDGDRVVFVDENGAIVRPEQLGVLLMQHCIPHPRLVYDLKCASILPQAAKRLGGESIMQPSGHGFIKKKMIESSADIGVEVSGHHFFKILGGGDDALFTSLVILELLGASGKSMSQLIEPIGWPVITPDLRIPFSGDAGVVLDSIAANCGGVMCRIDGVRADYDEGWALARASITEPAITVRMEADNLNSLQTVADMFFHGAPELGVKIKEMLK